MTAPSRSNKPPRNGRSDRRAIMTLILTTVALALVRLGGYNPDSEALLQTLQQQLAFDNTIVNNNNNNNSERDPTQQTECCLHYCTRPSTTVCCQRCNETFPDHHDIVMALLEGLTVHLRSFFSKKDYKWLRDRSWQENSHIGNRNVQGIFYYDWVRSKALERLEAQPSPDAKLRFCEIGFNGGHSALVFLAATASLLQSKNQENELSSHLFNNKIQLTVFDLQQFTYSQPSLDYVEKLYPERVEVRKGDSHETVKQFAQEEGRVCDLFSVDGDHSIAGSMQDIRDAVAATKVGGWLILDDMATAGPRRALDSLLRGKLPVGNLHCLDTVQERVSRIHRYDTTDTFDMQVGWCWIQVLA